MLKGAGARHWWRSRAAERRREAERVGTGWAVNATLRADRDVEQGPPPTWSVCFVSLRAPPTPTMKREHEDDEAAEPGPKRTATDEPPEAPPEAPPAAPGPDASADAVVAPAPAAPEPAAPPVAPPAAPPAVIAAAPPQPAAAPPPPQPVPTNLTGAPALVAILTANPSLVDGPLSMLTSTQDTTEVAFKLELPVDAVVAIFGYDGMTITTIRERTGCRVRLLEAGTSQTHRAFEVLGTQDGSSMVVGLVLAEMQKSCGTNPSVCTPSVGGPQYAVKLHVRADACGTIIGKGGATINQMRTASGAQIKVDSDQPTDMVPTSSFDVAAAAAAAGPGAPADRAISFSGIITAVHAALLDVIPRVVQFTKQVRECR